ncbi:hypothetical protein M527_04305 [Sphingobium indicum IP26]|uniref:DUF2726 domain-containing protein n=1 Tax=Sphingobium indicum TaxID=332055 RepID=UPI00037A6B06|nr:DUF2726 domain-containing protein [Sphingobium indicum]EPR11309.1 hypothetical protein M527_04305 [Sphingobium indicum IP26]
MAILLALSRGFGNGSGSPTPVAKPFMTRREQAVRSALEQILPMYRIHAQVALGALLAALLAAPRRPGRKPSPADRNAFSQKIVDFVIEDPTTGKVVALIEVDDHSHSRARDRLRDAMTSAAGYCTFRIAASVRPTIAAIREVIGRLRDEAAHAGSDMRAGHGA